MFTGIISNLGKLVKIDKTLFVFQTDEALCQKMQNGTSIAVNGVCLTVVGKTKNTFSVEIMPETAKKTMFASLKICDLVNLELPVTPHTLLSGHIVQGHVDGVGKIIKITTEGNSKLLTIEIPQSLIKYVVQKGAIALNGISLTVIDAKEDYFTVGIIPFTWEHTMLRTLSVGDNINIETDILAKYLEKLLKKEEK